ncbi:MAG: hypothetical protein ACD_46C00221G0018 [uncultured bacterium]|nr:MAG: hypothetical protein ACD_46C00221G0018 [uncultured bacterium]
MKLKNICYIAVILSLFSQSVFADKNTEKNTITYQNTRGSILKLSINSDNTLTGFFTTAVASKECQQAIGVKRPIVGYITKNALTFSVNYPECGVLTFIGNIEDNQKIIDTMAIVAHSSNHIAKEGPGARMISHDVFNRV